MKIIIYLASHDPSARANHRALVDERKWTLGEANVKLQVIEIDETHVIKIANPAIPSVFESLSASSAQEQRVELVAHGDGSPWIKCMPYGKWDDTTNASNTYKDINATQLRDFLITYASKDEHYKFAELTLFCCNGYRFAKELASLMPEIKITCFKEYIKILGADGMAYPYTVVKDGNQTLVKPIDKNGEIITREDQKHYSAPHWILEGNTEKTIYACADALPTHIASLSNTLDTRPVVIRGSMTSSSHQELRSLQEKTNATTPTVGTSAEIDESKKDVQPNTPRITR